MNIPNLLTMFRLSLIPVYIFLFFSCRSEYVPFAIVILLVAGLTDVADGYWARRTKQVTELGKILDPLADKLLALTVFFCLLWDRTIGLSEAVAFMARDIAMILCAVVIRLRGLKTVPANWQGKVSTLLLYPVVGGLLLGWPYVHFFLWSVIVLSYIAAGRYLREVWHINAGIR